VKSVAEEEDRPASAGCLVYHGAIHRDALGVEDGDVHQLLLFTEVD
jgi:hypothetical protein